MLRLCVLVSLLTAGHCRPDIPTSVASFSQQLYGSLAQGQSELVYSPLSIHSGLMMTSLGAAGRTLAEMGVALSMGGAVFDAQIQYQPLVTSLTSSKDAQVYIGNGVFMNSQHHIQQSFLKEIKAIYNGSAQQLDFSAPRGPEAPINAFVRAHTGGLVAHMLPDHSITVDTVMLLINTLYFNASWAHTFPLHNTGRRSFHQLGGAISQVDMMQDDRLVAVKRDAALGADVLQLHMKGGRFSMYIVLPQALDGLAAVESRIAGLNASDSLFSGLSNKFTHVVIPKFKIESSFDLKKALQNLGMTAAFDPSLAEFTGITPEPGAYISAVQHKAVVEVQESGVTAAAATAVTVYIKNLVMQTPESFIADHPFMFYLRDDQTRTVLFQGKYSG